MKQIPEYATQMFSCGKQAGDWMFSESNYKVIRNAIDTEKYQYLPSIEKEIRDELGLAEKIVIGHVGNFTPAKNHTFLLDVFQEILKREPEAILLLVGGGDGMDLVKEKAKNMGIQDSIIFTGIRTDVNRLLQVMDLFVFPSLYEGLPVTMIEAQAAGLPCVISDQVSGECIVTKGLVTRKSLDEAPVEWADYILQRVRQQKENHIEEIIAAGYDITTAAKWLEEYYLQCERK